MTPVQVLPPPMPQAKLRPATERRSPSVGPKLSPQVFEPPPLGFRPEIKIPPNPMANLRKVETPKPKDDFWVEEYRKEHSKSPNPNSTDTDIKPEIETASVTTEDSSGIVSNMTDNESTTTTPLQSETPIIKSPITTTSTPKIKDEFDNIKTNVDKNENPLLSPRPMENRYRNPSPISLIPLKKEKEGQLSNNSLPAQRQYAQSPITVKPNQFEVSLPIYQPPYQGNAMPTRTFNTVSPKASVYENKKLTSSPMQHQARSPQPYVTTPPQQNYNNYTVHDTQPNNIYTYNNVQNEPHKFTSPEVQRNVSPKL